MSFDPIIQEPVFVGSEQVGMAAKAMPGPKVQPNRQAHYHSSIAKAVREDVAMRYSAINPNQVKNQRPGLNSSVGLSELSNFKARTSEETQIAQALMNHQYAAIPA